MVKEWLSKNSISSEELNAKIKNCVKSVEPGAKSLGDYNNRLATINSLLKPLDELGINIVFRELTKISVYLADINILGQKFKFSLPVRSIPTGYMMSLFADYITDILYGNDIVRTFNSLKYAVTLTTNSQLKSDSKTKNHIVSIVHSLNPVIELRSETILIGLNFAKIDDMQVLADIIASIRSDLKTLIRLLYVSEFSYQRTGEYLTVYIKSLGISAKLVYSDTSLHFTELMYKGKKVYRPSNKYTTMLEVYFTEDFKILPKEDLELISSRYASLASVLEEYLCRI